MNKKLHEHKSPNHDHDHRKLTGDIYQENHDFFVIEFNPKTNIHELIVRDKQPVQSGLRSYIHQWYKIAEGTYDYCFGFLEGKYNKIRIKENYAHKTKWIPNTLSRH